MLYPNFTMRDSKNNHDIQSTNIIKRYAKQIKKCNGHKYFYLDYPHTNCGDKKSWGLKPLI